MSEVRQWLPEDLELMAPGPELAAVLAGVDRRLLSDRDRVRLLQSRNRLVAHLQAQLYTDMYAITWSEPPDDGILADEGQDPYPWSETEIAMALRWTHTAAGIRLEQARQLIEDLPAVHTALRDGVIDVPKALLFSGMLGVLDRQVARRIAEKVLDKAADLTTGQLRTRLRRLVIAADPDAARKQAAAALKGRRVVMYAGENNLASLEGHELAPHRAAAGWERIDAIAKAAKANGDPRRMDELRADALLDLLIGEGIAAGAPVTNGDMFSDLQPADTTPTAPTNTQTNPDQTNPDQTNPNQADFDQTDFDLRRAVTGEPDPAATTRAGRSRPSRIGQAQVRWSRVRQARKPRGRVRFRPMMRARRGRPHRPTQTCSTPPPTHPRPHPSHPQQTHRRPCQSRCLPSRAPRSSIPTSSGSGRSGWATFTTSPPAGNVPAAAPAGRSGRCPPPARASSTSRSHYPPWPAWTTYPPN